MSKRLLLPALLLVFASTSGQESNPVRGFMRTDLISPSPTAANLGKYGDVPVTYYTGMPNVSIPIFNVTGNELSLPISLTYNYNGLQPTQRASWVGLGWSLQAGGVITRVVGDKVEIGSIGYDRDSASNVDASRKYLEDSYERNLHDNLPDIYSFNFGNYSGRFICHNHVAYVMPDQKLKVEPVGGGFLITTEDGTKYLFDAIEETWSRSSPGAFYTIPHYTSAWYLTKVTNATDTESIRLYYDDDGAVVQYGMKTQTYYDRREFSPKDTLRKPIWPDPPSVVFPTNVATKRLVKIVSDKYRVEFDPDSRDDIEGTSKLESILVYSIGDKVVKKLNFNYDYFRGYYTNISFLKLQSMNLVTGSEQTKHTFEYFDEEGSFGAGILSSVDKYGYCKSGGPFGDVIIDKEVYQYGVDRKPNFSAAVKGALKKITYPTGGSTDFTYEANHYYDGDKFITYDRVASAQDWSFNHEIRDTYFEFSKDAQVEVNIYRKPINPQEPFVPHDNKDEFEVREAVITIVQRHFGPDTVITVSPNAIYRGKIPGGSTDSTAVIKFLLAAEPGVAYILRAVCDDKESDVSVVMKWKEVTDIPEPGPLGPGIRLKDLTHNNGFGNTITKKFSYVNERGFSSGRILQSNLYDSYEYKENFYFYALNQWGLPSHYQKYLVHTSMIAESSGAGLPFYYTKVAEETTSGEEKHRTNFTYEYFYGTKSVELIEKNEFVQTDSIFQLQSKLLNTFSNEFQGEAFGGMRVFVKEYHSIQPNYVYGTDLKVEAVYWKHPVSTKQTQYENGQPLVTEVKSYYDFNDNRNLIGMKRTNSDGTILYTKYKYPEDYGGVSSASEMVLNHMLSPVIEEQVWKKNFSGAPDSVMISGKITEYNGKRVSAIYVLESARGIDSLDNETTHANGKYTSLISDSRYRKKIDFTYNAYGNIVQQQLSDQPPVSYLWAYPAFTLSASAVQGKMYPVAEIKNAKPDSVYSTSFEDNVSGITMASATGFKAIANTFTVPGSYSGSYKLTYWKKSGSSPWQLIVLEITNPNNYVINEPGSYIDEVRLHPVKAQMTTYTYWTEFGIATINDPNNKITYYEYDSAGRLKAIKDHNGDIINAYKYHVKDQVTIAE